MPVAGDGGAVDRHRDLRPASAGVSESGKVRLGPKVVSESFLSELAQFGVQMLSTTPPVASASEM